MTSAAVRSFSARAGMALRGAVVGRVAAMLILTASQARGQGAEPPAIEASAAIAARMHWITYNMVSGRVAASSNLSVPKMHVQSPGRLSRRRETLAIEINGGICDMQYDSSAPGDDLTIFLAGGNQLSIRRTLPNDRYKLDFQQRPDQPLSLVVEQGDTKRAVHADGFWQLYLVEPQLVRGHLVPLLELLHPSWQLAATGADIEEALLRTQLTPAGQHEDRKQWARLVQSLASVKFFERENSERELYRAGQAVVPFLQGLDRQRLDAEQVARIRSIVESLSVDYEDRPQRVAAWLASDERVWLALLDRDDPARRRIAAKQLGKLLGEPVEFNPDDSAEMRQAQLEHLQTRLEAARQAQPVEE